MNTFKCVFMGCKKTITILTLKLLISEEGLLYQLLFPTCEQDRQISLPDRRTNVLWTTDEENDELFMKLDMDICNNEGGKRALKEEIAGSVKKARMEIDETPRFTKKNETCTKDEEVDSPFSI
ncbi:Hypothetical protein CINCED_3A021559 [Cinara cedri]|uniref:Uncharacterized protein n=1 Tax=Cinara cedri TaxID=506608 RepID=A0A5E4MJF0_9HEMI|nr:Hypothetical protein CINCED_3A021559 [Cinara cedri]